MKTLRSRTIQTDKNSTRELSTNGINTENLNETTLKKKSNRKNLSGDFYIQYANESKNQNFKRETICNLDVFPDFKNLITSTTIKPKKPTKSIDNCSDDEKSLQNRMKSKKGKKMKKKNTSILLGNKTIINEDHSEQFNKTPTVPITSDRRGNFNKTPSVSIVPDRRETFTKTSNICNNEDIFNKSSKDFENIIDIGDSILNDTIDVEDSPQKSNIRRSTFNKTNENLKDDIKNETFQLKNSSGEWQVENTVVNISDDEISVENKENTSNDKNIRKKWLKFSRNSVEAKLVLSQIGSPLVKNKIQTPMQVKIPELTKINNKSAKTEKSAKKAESLSIKRTKLPNFVKIHQKAYDKMENLKEYSERKKERAEMLLSKNSIAKEEPKTKISRQLYPDGKYNRFGFKIMEVKKPEPPPVALFSRPEIIEVAKKTKNIAKNRENRREILKGVRTNRRFELLMKMRHN